MATTSLSFRQRLCRMTGAFCVLKPRRTESPPEQTRTVASRPWTEGSHCLPNSSRVSPKLHTLTVPDLLWINLQLTGETVPYHYARLEEAVFTQFGHGSSRDVPAQAAGFLTEFARLRPFTRGNDACAFVGCLTFLAMNGHRLKLVDSEAAEWARGIWADPDSVHAGIQERLAVQESDHGSHPDHYETARTVLDQFPETLQELVKNEAPVPVG